MEGNAEPFLGAQTPKTEEPPILMDGELDEIVGELGYDVEVVG